MQYIMTNLLGLHGPGLCIFVDGVSLKAVEQYFVSNYIDFLYWASLLLGQVDDAEVLPDIPMSKTIFFCLGPTNSFLCSSIIFQEFLD